MTISASTFSGNGQYGFYAWGTTSAAPPSLSSNIFSSNSYGSIALDVNTSDASIADSNTLAFPLEPIFITGGPLSHDVSWNNNRVYAVQSNILIYNGWTLTIPPSRIVKFYQYTNINIFGTLSAPGTSGNPIYFSDYRDDAAGGDTNNDGTATSPAPGWWEGIHHL